jgi:hypothetical protein
MGAVKSRTTVSEPPPLPTRFTWEEYSRLRELPGPVYEIADGLFVYETTVYVRKPTEEDEGEVKEEETSEIRFFSENPLSEGVVYLSLCGYKLVFEHFHNRGVEVYEKLRAGLFVPTGATKRRRVFFERPRVYDRPATEPRVCHERSTDEEYLQFIFE